MKATDTDRSTPNDNFLKNFKYETIEPVFRKMDRSRNEGSRVIAANSAYQRSNREDNNKSRNSGTRETNNYKSGRFFFNRSRLPVHYFVTLKLDRLCHLCGTFGH